MAEVVLFHHALGLTAGCLSFAATLRASGHTVHAPDLYAGACFDKVADGLRHLEWLGFETILERGRQAVDNLPEAIVYGGFSLGVMPAQMLAQTRPGAKGALFFHAAVPLAAFGGTWPDDVPLEIHTMENDALGDLDVAKELAGTIASARLFLYPGDRHLFMDRGSRDYDPVAATLVEQRVLTFLGGIA